MSKKTTMVNLNIVKYKKKSFTKTKFLFLEIAFFLSLSLLESKCGLILFKFLLYIATVS